MSLPQVITEIAFTANPGDSTYTWVDISSDVKAVHYQRGRNTQLNQIQGGTSAVTLKNLNRNYEPAYAAGSHYPNIVPMKPIRVRLVISSISYTLFTHFVETWPELQTGPSYAEMQITGVDGFEMLTNNTLPGASYPEELSGARIARVLDAVGWPSTLRSLSGGQSKVQSYTFTDADQVNALSHIQTVTDAEAGLFFCAGNGMATFLDRYALIASPYSVSQLTISDRTADVPGIASVAYAASKPSYDKTLIVNDQQVQPTANAAYPSLVLQEAIDSTSKTAYFVRTNQVTVPLTSNVDALSLAQYLVLLYRNPLLRHDSLTIKPARDTTKWTQLATREIGDRITVLAHPPGGGSAYDQDERIQWINVTIPTDVSQTVCEWGTYPAGSGSGGGGNFLILDDAVLGVMDSTNTAGY